MRPIVVLAAGVLLAAPQVVSAQCGIDTVEDGIQAYRDLRLSVAVELLERVVAANGDNSTSCATVNARALTYLGATHLLAERPSDAARAFERAIIQAPRHQPDAIEFPPAVTDLFEQVQRRTPAVAVSLPDAVDIGPDDAEALTMRVTASTDHWVDATVRALDDDEARALYHGPVSKGPQGLSIDWDGRASTGRLVQPGRYELEIVSLMGRTRPVRKLIFPITVESDGSVRPGAPAIDTARFLASNQGRPGASWKAFAAGGAGLLAGAFVIAMPNFVDGAPESGLRYPVAGGLAVAGIVGMVRRLGEDDRAMFAVRDTVLARPSDRAVETTPRTLHVRVGSQRRVELVETTSGHDASIREDR